MMNGFIRTLGHVCIVLSAVVPASAIEGGFAEKTFTLLFGWACLWTVKEKL